MVAVASAGCTEQGAAGPACRDEGSCPDGQTCVNGQCVVKTPEGHCDTTDDCDGGMICNLSKHLCEAASVPECDEDVDCDANERCNTALGRCEVGARTCAVDATCQAINQRCDTRRGFCVECLSVFDCDDPKVCMDGECKIASDTTCANDTGCNPPYTVCENTTCVLGCGAAGSSIVCDNEATHCNTEIGRCVDIVDPPTPCSHDTDCDPPTSVCENSICAPGCGQEGGLECGSEASPGTVCDAPSGRCVLAPPEGKDLNENCVRDGDCASRTCFDFEGTIGKRCIEACGKASECPTAFTCYDLHGAKMCLSAELFNDATFAEGTGAYCESGLDCKSNFCPYAPGLCVDTCARNADCGTSSDCRWIEHTANEYISACAGTGGGLPGGTTCSSDADCQSGVCYGSGRCGDLCRSTANCTSNEVCAPVDYSACLSATTPCSRWSVNLVNACIRIDGGSIGSKSIGAPCSSASECKDGFCETTLGMCTGICTTDADCPTEFECSPMEYDVLSDGSRLFANFCRPEP